VRARKVINRVFRGTTYYRWIVSVPPKEILKLGWVDGQPLQCFVRGSTLVIEPSSGATHARKGVRSSDLEDTIRRRTVGQTEERTHPG
jgi:hypothetical protein